MPDHRSEPDQRKGFVAPRSNDGRASLYGPPPWHFAGRSITVLARCKRSGIEALLPPSLRAAASPIVRLSAHWLQCDLGLGRGFPGREPERAQFHEAVVGIAAETADGLFGYWDPFLWCDSDAEIAVGREMYGWPQRAGNIAMTMPDPLRGFTIGEAASACVSRLGRPVFDLSVELQAAGPLKSDAPAFVTFFTERILPNPVDGTTTREMFASEMQGVEVAHVMHGSAKLRLSASELSGLTVEEVVGGQVHAIRWTKNRSRLISRD